MKKRDEYVVNGRICIYQLTASGEWKCTWTNLLISFGNMLQTCQSAGPWTMNSHVPK